MREFEIFTDSCSDLPIDYVKEKGIKFASLSCTYNGNTYVDDLGQSLQYKKFFSDLRNGAMPITSQPNADEFYNKFKEILDRGKDVLYICVSTGVSGTENSANIAKNMLEEDNIQGTVVIVNTLTASLGQGLMVIKAVEMKEEGKPLNEIVQYIEDNKQNLNTYMTVDDLHHLKRGGRLSTAAAMIGIVLHVKPILTINNEGRVLAIGKTRGRKASINKLAEIVIENIRNSEEQILCISHGDCIEEAIILRDLILSKIKVRDVVINFIGAAVGTHGGPACISVSFMGEKRHHNIIK